MKKLLFLSFLLMQFAACVKDPTVTTNLPKDLAVSSLEEAVTMTALLPDESVQGRGTCNLYCKVAFRDNAVYNGSAANPCFRRFRVMRRDAAQTFPGVPITPWIGPGNPPVKSAGTDLTLVVPDNGTGVYYVDFDWVQSNSATQTAPFPFTHVFFSNDIQVFADPVTFATVAWVFAGPIGPNANPDVSSNQALVNVDCTVVPF